MTTIRDIYDWRKNPENFPRNAPLELRREKTREMLSDGALKNYLLRQSYAGEGFLEEEAKKVSARYFLSAAEYFRGVGSKKPGIQTETLINALNASGFYSFSIEQFDFEAVRRIKIRNTLLTFLSGAAETAALFALSSPDMHHNIGYLVNKFISSPLNLTVFPLGVMLSGFAINGSDPTRLIVDAATDIDHKLLSVRNFATEDTSDIFPGLRYSL